MSLSKENKYPEIRFKGFTEAWEQRKFENNIKEIQTGTKLLGKEYNDGMPLIKMGNIQRGSFSLSKVEQLEGMAEPENILNYGDFLFNTRNTLELVGKGATWMGKSGKVAFNSNIARFTFTGIDTIFFNYLYNTSKMISQIRARAVGTTSVAAVYPKDLNSMSYYLPSEGEQKQIGSLFKQLDNTIALHQQKVDKLEKLKKAYLQDIFPKKEEMPMISFSNNQGTWNIRKFKDFIKKTGKNNKEGKDYYAYSVSNKLGLVKQSEQFEGSRLDDLSKTDYKIVLPGEFVYNPARINVGSIAYNDSETIIIVSSLYVVLKMNELLNNGYILSIIATSDFINEVKRNTEGSVREYLFFNSFRNIKFPYLNSTSDQKKIGLFFQDLNKIITLTRKKVDKLKKIKKAYLQKMFV